MPKALEIDGLRITWLRRIGHCLRCNEEAICRVINLERDRESLFCDDCVPSYVYKAVIAGQKQQIAKLRKRLREHQNALDFGA